MNSQITMSVIGVQNLVHVCFAERVFGHNQLTIVCEQQRGKSFDEVSRAFTHKTNHENLIYSVRLLHSTQTVHSSYDEECLNKFTDFVLRKSFCVHRFHKT